MNRNLSFLALALLTYSTLSFATTNTEPTQTSKAAPETMATAKSINLELYPTSAIVGIYGGQASFGLGEDFSVGPLASGVSNEWFQSHTRYTGYNIGVQASYYLKNHRFQSGPVLNAFAGYSNITREDRDLADVGFITDRTYSSFFAGATVGYQWVLKSGINFTLGGGFTAYSAGRGMGNILNADNSYSTSKATLLSYINPALLGNVGYAF